MAWHKSKKTKADKEAEVLTDPRKEREKPPAKSVPGPIAAAGGKIGELLGAKRAESSVSRMKLLVSIVNLRNEVRLKEILDEYSVALSYSFAGTGTARSAVLDYLGIGETEKAIVLSLIPESDEKNILDRLRKEMSLYLVGRGISFTVPLTGITSIAAEGLARAAANKTTDPEAVMKGSERKYDLIVAAVAANYVDTAMEAARSAGAQGGTILRARSLGNAKAEQFIGISLAQEQEILLILTKKELSLSVMQALSEKVGAKTPAAGIVFSLPVDRTAGISADEEGSGEDK